MTWGKITAKDKITITTDWNELFPALGKYKPMHLMNRLGPLLVGILLEVKSGNDSYTPTFHIHNLVRPFPVISLNLKRTLDERYVHLEWHNKQYRELAMKMKETALIPFDGDVSLDVIIKGFMAYIDMGIYPFLPSTYEDMILVSAWCGDYSQVNKGLVLAESQMRLWPEHVLSRIGGLDTWLESVECKTKNRENLIVTSNRQSIELNVQDLPVRNIIVN